MSCLKDELLFKEYTEQFENVMKLNKKIEEFKKLFGGEFEDAEVSTDGTDLIGPSMNTLVGHTLDLLKQLKAVNKELHNETDSTVDIIGAENISNNRRKSVLIWGLGAISKENVTAEIIDVVCNKMNVDITREDIRYCYSYGSGIAAEKRPILVRFQSHYIFSLVWKSRDNLKDTGLYMSLHIPMKTRKLFTATQRIFGNTNSFVFEGQVVVMTPDKVAHWLNCDLDLKQLVDTWFEKK